MEDLRSSNVMVFTIIPASNSKHKPWYDVKRRNGGHGTKAISGKQSPNTKATAVPDGGGLVNANDHYTFAQPYYPYYGNYYRGSTKTHLNQYQPQSQPLRTSTSSFVQKRGGTSQFSPSQLNVNKLAYQQNATILP
ncbi:hypothetical protein BLOT_007862 [Blomia tropicalis]|nr:hypothetical protein BLOT_007862 [Blomia tropicalis]